MELYGQYRFKVILMASERVEDVNGVQPRATRPRRRSTAPPAAPRCG
jgi:hypothetical protein